MVLSSFCIPGFLDVTIKNMPNDLIDILLSKRGILGKEERQAFINPSYDAHMYDPYLMRDMEKAVVRLFEAMEANEKVVVYSDYDCDGIPGAVILSDLLDKCGYSNYEVYIPDRHDEGYGLHEDAVKGFIEDGVNLIITIDLGVSAKDEVLLAQSNGVDVIVTDHHLPGENISEPYAILNPKVDEYPYDMLCGSGVIFKFVQGFLIKYREYYKINEGWEKWLLDMAGLATLSDMVPLLGENRVIAYFGLQVIRKSRRPGLVELFKVVGVNQRTATEDDIAFSITPKINAASRLASPRISFDLLKTKDEREGKILAQKLGAINEERKNLVALTMKEAKKKIKEREIEDVIVVGDMDWRPGILGLVATRIMEEHKVPVFVWGSDGEGVIKGSCRSNTYGVMEIMSGAKDHLTEYGGHHGAGGFSTKKELIMDLEIALKKSIEFLKSDTNPHEILENVEIQDAITDLSKVEKKTYELLNTLAPFGHENPKPVLLFMGVTLLDVKNFGKTKEHLEIKIKDDYGESGAIAFFKTKNSFPFILEKGKKVDLFATLELSNWRGYENLRLRIIDLRESK